MRAAKWVAVATAASSAWGAVSWDEHDTVGEMRWTARATGAGAFELGSDREGERAVRADTGGKVTIPACFKNGQVKALGARAFAGLGNITEAVIPDGVEDIGEEAFVGCTGLERVVLPASSRFLRIRKRAFAGCTALREVVLPPCLWWIGESAFAGCTRLERLEIGDQGTIAKIGPQAFAGCTALERITLPLRIDWVAEGAFAGCTELQEVVFTRPVILGRGAFAGCANLKNVSGIHFASFETGENSDWQGKRWGDLAVPGTELDAFGGCFTVVKVDLNTAWLRKHEIAAVFPDARNSIKRVELANGSLRVPSGLFRGCTALETVTVPDSVSAVDDGAFSECGNLKNVEVPKRLAAGAWTQQLPEGCRGVAR